MNEITSLLEIMNIVGLFAFAASGVLKGIEKHMDIFGCIFLGIFTALGGGIIRDFLTNNLPPLIFRKESDLFFVLLSILLTFAFSKQLIKIKKALYYLDALGLGAFAGLGGGVALKLGLSFSGVVFSALFTGVGGGIIRDILSMEIPIVFKKEIYATCAITGGITLYVLHFFLSIDISIFLASLITFLFRVIAIVYNLHLPKIQI